MNARKKNSRSKVRKKIREILKTQKVKHPNLKEKISTMHKSQNVELKNQIKRLKYIYIIK